MRFRVAHVWLLLALVAGAVVSGSTYKSSVTVTEEGTTFKVVFFETGCEDPFRVSFVQDGVRSVYKFDDSGRLSVLKVGFTRYAFSFTSSVEDEMPEMSAQYMRHGHGMAALGDDDSAANHRRRGRVHGGTSLVRPSGAGGDRRVLLSMQEKEEEIIEEEKKEEKEAAESTGLSLRGVFDCDDCEKTLDSVCDIGVPDVCFLVTFFLDFFNDDAQASLQTMCTVLGTACETPSSELCEDTCISGENVLFVSGRSHRAIQHELCRS